MENCGVVCATRCIPSEKKYVGIHTGGRQSYLGSGKAFRCAVRKYGRENFVRETIAVFETIEEGRTLERFWIGKLHSKAPGGYNLCDGGEGVFNPCPETRHSMGSANRGKVFTEERRHNMACANANRGKVFTEERKAKIGLSHIGQKHSEETKTRISVAKKGSSSPFKGRHHTEATKLKMHKKHKPMSEEQKAKYMGHVAWNKGIKTGSSVTKGRPHSEEWNAKVSAARRAAHRKEQT